MLLDPDQPAGGGVQAPVSAGFGVPEYQSHGSGADILYAEDDELLRSCTEALLTRAGHRVTGVGDGQAAWEALELAPFSLLITDNDMPKLTGMELVTRLRRKGNQMPILLASGSAGFFSSEAFKWLQFSDCLQKPFDPMHLLESIKVALARGKTRLPLSLGRESRL